MRPQKIGCARLSALARLERDVIADRQDQRPSWGRPR